MHIQIRRAGAPDAATLAQLRLDWRAHELGEATDQDSFRSLFISWVHSHLDTHIPYLAEADGTAVGMAWLMLADRVPSPERPDRHWGDVQSVYVAPSHRNTGVGGQLIAAVLEEARTRRLEHVTVHSSDRAQPFYLRSGFHDGQRWFEWRL